MQECEASATVWRNCGRSPMAEEEPVRLLVTFCLVVTLLPLGIALAGTPESSGRFRDGFRDVAKQFKHRP
jgi:hypothetical protein